LWIPGFVGNVAFTRLAHYREQGYCRDSEAADFSCLFEQQIDAEAFDVGHRFDRLSLLLAIDDEHRIDEITGTQTMLTHQAPGKFVSTHASFAGIGKYGHAYRLCCK
jgi:hypothetical protein